MRDHETGKMREDLAFKSQKHPLLKLLYVVVFLCFMIVAVKIYLRQDKEIDRLAHERAELKVKLDEAHEDAKKIEELKNMSGSKEFIERMARDELGLVRPDEIIFVH